MDDLEILKNHVRMLPLVEAIGRKIMREGYRVHDYADSRYPEHHLCVLCDQDLRVAGVTVTVEGFKVCGACALGAVQCP